MAHGCPIGCAPHGADATPPDPHVPDPGHVPGQLAVDHDPRRAAGGGHRWGTKNQATSPVRPSWPFEDFPGLADGPGHEGRGDLHHLGQRRTHGHAAAQEHGSSRWAAVRVRHRGLGQWWFGVDAATGAQEGPVRPAGVGDHRGIALRPRGSALRERHGSGLGRNALAALGMMGGFRWGQGGSPVRALRMAGALGSADDDERQGGDAGHLVVERDSDDGRCPGGGPGDLPFGVGSDGPCSPPTQRSRGMTPTRSR